QVRQLSTTAARPVSKLVKPPIQVYGLEGRYATALYSAASKQKKLEQVEKELTRVWVRCSTTRAPAGGSRGASLLPLTREGLGSCDLGDSQPTGTCTACLWPWCLNGILGRNSSLGGWAGPGTGCPEQLPSFSFSSVVFFQPLDEASLTELKSALNGFLSKGEVLKLETKTDPSILGGMIVNIGEKYVDMSTRSKIQKLTKIMRETV
ncbi:ATPO synthase, partial [Chaetorhynchus papuensis]|nr:ATPO synthase [Chaetorhynchus papuensis]